jgi:pimeloyl-ACP methyl ester carboxylesterase
VDRRSLRHGARPGPRAGFTACPEYQAAILGFYRKHVCRLGEIEVPTLLVGGRYDECTPSHLAAMHLRIRGSQLRIIEDASHLCFAEQPAEFATTLNAFFDLTDRGSGL